MIAESKNKYFFEQASFREIVPKFIFPSIFGMLVVFLYNFADTYFVSTLDDASALAALSVSMPLFTIFMGIGNIFGIGCGTAISHYMGKKDHAAINNMATLSLYGCAFSGILMGIIGAFLLPYVLPHMGGTGEIYGPSYEYGRILVLGGGIITTSLAMSHVARSIGAAKESMIGLFIGTLSNIALDAFFILYLDWGVAGAAYGTIIGNLLCVAYFLEVYNRRIPEALSFTYKWERSRISEMLSIGFPPFISNLFMIASLILLNRISEGYGVLAVAVFGIAIKINMLPKFITMGISRGVQPFIGYNYGAGNTERMNYFIRNGHFWSSAFCIVLGILLLLFSRSVLEIFLSDEASVQEGISLIRITLISVFFLGFMQLTATTAQAKRKKIQAFYLALAHGGFFLVVLLVAQLFDSLLFLALTFPISDALTTLLCLYLPRTKIK